MRVILINPPIDSVLANGHVNPVTQYLFYNSAPLGILYLASVLEQAGHQVAVIDASAELLDVAHARDGTLVVALAAVGEVADDRRPGVGGELEQARSGARDDLSVTARLRHGRTLPPQPGRWRPAGTPAAP